MRASKALAAALALFALAGAGSAGAQVMGLYYQEVEKDGRVYVFNTPEAYKFFTSAGEMAKSVTLLGRAEGGKTLVAENETAADLYFFKHDLPGYERPTPEPPKLPFDVSWKDGKTTIKSKSAELKISNRIQFRFTSEDLDDNSGTSGPERESFRIRRAKTKFEGWFYVPDLTYELQLNWADSANSLEDANVNYDFSHHKGVMVKVGQFKVPFGRQELTSSGSQQFVDRSAVSNAFARGRDVGIQLWGTPGGGKIDWRVGLFNGNGRTVSRNDNDELQLNARLQWAPFGDPKYSEGDFDSSDRPLFAIAAGYEDNTTTVAASGSTAAHELDRTIVGFDATFKWKGLSIFGEYFDRENDRSLASLSDFDDDGYVFQAGYVVVPKTFEIALRLAELDPNKDVSGNERSEDGVAFSYYFNKHNHKLQADYRQLEDDARDAKDKELRLQYQIIF